MLSFKKRTYPLYEFDYAHLPGDPMQFPKSYLSGKRAFLFTFQKKAVLTVEAAVVLPLFLAAVLTVLGFAQLLLVQQSLLNPLYQTGKKLARDTYAVEFLKTQSGIGDALEDNFVIDQLSVLAARSRIISEAEKQSVNWDCVVNEKDGVSFLFSKVPDEEGMVDLVMHYRMHLPLQIVPLPDIPVTQRCRVHAWLGYMPTCADEDEQTVYVTQNGTVYHLNKTCTHLQLSVQQVFIQEIPSLRNNGGRKYDPCELCGENCGTKVYITKEGSRYHAALSCGGLKRGIRVVLLSEVEGKLPPCKRCRKG